MTESTENLLKISTYINMALEFKTEDQETKINNRIICLDLEMNKNP
jgi:hypothetical protein